MSFSVVQNRIRLVRGDSAEIRLVICDRVTGEPFIPGKHDELAFTLKQNFADEKPVLTKTLEQGIRQEGAACFLVFWPDDTRNLPCGRYIYDVELVRENGYTDTPYSAPAFFPGKGRDGQWHIRGTTLSAFFPCPRPLPGTFRKDASSHPTRNRSSPLTAVMRPFPG